MSNHRRTQDTVPNNAQPDNFRPTDALESLHAAILRVETIVQVASDAYFAHRERRNRRMANTETAMAIGAERRCSAYLIEAASFQVRGSLTTAGGRWGAGDHGPA
jgi:hypothetical protein